MDSEDETNEVLAALVSEIQANIGYDVTILKFTTPGYYNARDFNKFTTAHSYDIASIHGKVGIMIINEHEIYLYGGQRVRENELIVDLQSPESFDAIVKWIVDAAYDTWAGTGTWTN